MARFCLFSILLVLALLSPLSSARTVKPQKQSFLKLDAERLIRSFNLSTKHPINTLKNDPSAASQAQLVEKRLELPVVGAPSDTDLGHHAGYYSLPHSKAARMFYFFFETRGNKSDPVVIWLSGGPGCSSSLALFYENGPFHIRNDLSLVWNDYGWDKVSNLLYVDQPTGTGFSYTLDESDIRHDEVGVSNDLYDFLQAFFKEHPEYGTNDFYITGESYAGHYIPAFASRVQQGNKAKEGININLKGFAIGNGLTNPEIQYNAYADYALDMKLIGQLEHDWIDLNFPVCQQAIRSCGSDGGVACSFAYGACTSIFNYILTIAGNINYYDVRKQCEGRLCYDFSNVETYLNQESVRQALGVGDIEFVSCSTEVYSAMQTDWMRNYEVGIPALLEDGIEALIYAGEYDLICNWLGNSRWVEAMEWSGQQQFVASTNISFTVDGAAVGDLRNYGPLTFLKNWILNFDQISHHQSELEREFSYLRVFPYYEKHVVMQIVHVAHTHVNPLRFIFSVFVFPSSYDDPRSIVCSLARMQKLNIDI